MRAMILAAGQGKRLRPITATIPKPMVQAGGKTLLEHHFDKLKAIGITDLVVNGAYLKDVLFGYLQDGSSFGLKISVSAEDADGLETAGGIIKALPLLGSEPFLVINGDIFLDTPYDFLLPCPEQIAKQQRLAHLFLTSNPAHNAKGDFALSDSGDLIYGSDYTFAGFAWYHPQAFAGRAVCREPLRPYFDRWIEEKQITASVLSARWFDVGTVERLNDLNAYLEDKTNSLNS
ncbi:nucleotidyltransferase family protein [uncultured Anaerobiospirillum sp.]|uniref:nucleotidyltransferase family protein n=1 Tax=uncultured Anaerobiospirillum sp. TaxID=265728 RepID=UPI0028052E07|nr:nucleotidyltransferase family protein [uncultured Anaerobiospirillum sp.]